MISSVSRGVIRIIVVLLVLSIRLSAQQPAYMIMGEDPFRGVKIYDLIQDKNLNYWIATNEGLFFYDYYNFEKLECDKAKSNSVFNLVMNPDGVIYCHNLNNQIFTVRDGQLQLLYELQSDESRQDISLEIGDDGNLVIGASKAIVLNADGKPMGRYTIGRHFLGPVFRDDDGNIHYHQSISDSILTYANGVFQTHKLAILNHEPAVKEVLQFFKIEGVSYALDLTTKDLYLYDARQFTLSRLPHNAAFERSGSIRIYETGHEIWIAGTLQGTVMLTNKTIGSNRPVYYEDYFISGVSKDQEGNIMLSTFDKGVIVIPDLNVPDVIHTFRDDPMTAVTADPDLGLVLGSSKGKIVYYKDEQFHDIKTNGQRAIELLCNSPLSDLIIFEDGQINAYNKRTKQTIEVMGASLKDVAFINDREFYLGTNVGVFKVVWDGKRSFRHEKDKITPKRVYSLALDPLTQSLYAATSDGLMLFSPAGSTSILDQGNAFYPTRMCYANGKVYAVDKKNNLLTIENGQVINRIQVKLSGKSEMLNKLIFHDGTLFAKSPSAFYQFGLDGKIVKSFRSQFDFSSRRILDIAIHEDKLWVSHSGGVQEVSLQYVQPASSAPTIRFDKIRVNDIAVNYAQTGYFGNAQRKVQFVFSSPSLRNRETLRYHYKLMGYDPNWISSDFETNQITYNALAPGTYTFMVKAENQSMFSETVAYKFTIARPLYARWWFMGLVLIAFLLMVYAIYRWQLNIQHKKSQQINELNASRLTAIQSQMNPHFIFNSLNSIQDLILKGDVEHSYSYITTFSNLVRSTLNYSGQDFIEFEQEIKLLELYLSLEKLRFKKELTYELDYEEIEDIMVPPLLIQPFIENALVHGLLHKEGEKKLHISFALEDVLICTIEDNGIGRERARAIKLRQRSSHESFSGKAIHRRFEILSNVFGGQFGYTFDDLYTDGEPTGTRVILRIPVKRKF